MAPDTQLEKFNAQISALESMQNSAQKLNLLFDAMTTVEGIKDPNQQLDPLKVMKAKLGLLAPTLRGNDVNRGRTLSDAVNQRLENLQKSNGSVIVKSGFPVDFSLYDENLHYVLYITDDPSKDQKLKVELKNTSGQEIDLSALVKPEMADKSNFELRFRKGVLSDRTLGILRKSTPELSKLSILSDADQAIWDVSLNETIADDKHAVSLSFRNIQSVPIPLSPDSSLTLNLQNISAEAGSGARGTRVEFIPREMRFNSGKNTPVTGNREQHLFITNHSGQKYIPLHVGFVGSNRILNDGQVHHDLPLTLRIQNVAKPAKPGQETAITLKAGQNAPSRFTMSFDVQDGDDKSKPWALCKASELKTVVESGTTKDFKLDKKTTIKGLIYNTTSQQWESTTNASLVTVGDLTAGLAQSRELAVTFKQDIKLNSGDYIEIVLSGFQSSLPSGFAHMYLNYNNIPGYWDGHFVLTVEKMPLLFSDGNNVGIGGVPDSSAKLQVYGTTTLNGDVTIATGKSLTIGGTTTLNDNVTIAANKGLTVGGITTLKGNVTIDTSKSFTVGGITTLNDNVSIATGKSLTVGGATTLNDNVTIATGKSLTVGGATVLNDNVAIAANKSLTVGGTTMLNGKVGIGTSKPSALLQVGIPGTDIEGYFENNVTLGIVQAANNNVGLSLINPNGNATIQLGSPSKSVWIKMDKVNGNLVITGGDVTLGGSLKPNYDSGWVKDDRYGHNRSDYPLPFDHNFGVYPSLVTIYFLPEGSNEAILLTWTWGEGYSGNPVNVCMTTTQVILYISVGRALHGLWKPGFKEWKYYDKGSWKVLAWK